MAQRIVPGAEVGLTTHGWGSKTYKGKVLAFVPKNTSLYDHLPKDEDVNIRAAKFSTVDRYLVRAESVMKPDTTGRLMFRPLRKPRFFAPLAGMLEDQNPSAPRKEV